MTTSQPSWLTALQSHTPMRSRERQRALANVGHFLEQYVAEALKTILTRRWHEAPSGEGWHWGPVTVVVSGLLSFVPVHAWSPVLLDDATTEPKYHMPLMYAPSARQALRARRHPRPTARTRRILSLADPEPRGHATAPLPYARLESMLICQTAYDARRLHGELATPEAFFALSPQYDVLHLACHGSLGVGGPGSAQLELAGATLSADQIVERVALDGTVLVILSACRSGEQNKFVPEEALDLGSVFLLAGARGVVANMWPVDDLAAALVVCHMFELWNWGDGLPIHAAIHASRLWLKELTVADLKVIAQSDSRWAPAIERYTRFMQPTTKRFWEPYYWAAFAYAGG